MTGRGTAHILIPSGFKPLLIEREAMWALVEDENGALAVATIAYSRQIVDDLR